MAELWDALRRLEAHFDLDIDELAGTAIRRREARPASDRAKWDADLEFAVGPVIEPLTRTVKRQLEARDTSARLEPRQLADILLGVEIAVEYLRSCVEIDGLPPTDS